MNEGPAGNDDKAVFAALEKLPDAALREVITRAHKLLKDRAAESRREVIREIHRLAKEHGIKVEVGEPKRRPGRPAKS